MNNEPVMLCNDIVSDIIIDTIILCLNTWAGGTFIGNEDTLTKLYKYLDIVLQFGLILCHCQESCLRLDHGGCTLVVSTYYLTLSLSQCFG